MFIKLLNLIPFFYSALFLPAFVRLSSVYCKNKGLQRWYFLELLNAPLSPAPRAHVFVRTSILDQNTFRNIEQHFDQ